MMTVHRVLNKHIRRTTLVVLACSVLLTPAYAVSAERDGTVIYFTFEDLQQMFSHSSPPHSSKYFPASPGEISESSPASRDPLNETIGGTTVEGSTILPVPGRVRCGATKGSPPSQKGRTRHGTI